MGASVCEGVEVWKVRGVWVWRGVGVWECKDVGVWEWGGVRMSMVGCGCENVNECENDNGWV